MESKFRAYLFEEIFRFFRLKLELFFRQQAVVIFRAQSFRYRQYLKKRITVGCH